MENNINVEHDIESRGNTSPMPLSAAPEPRWSQPLYKALMKKNWNVIKDILDRDPEAINGPVGIKNDMPFYLAIECKMPVHIIKNLVNLTPLEKLNSSTTHGKPKNSTAIHMAVSNNDFLAVELLISKIPSMLNSLNGLDQTPLKHALYFRKKEMAYYLLNLTSVYVEDEESQPKDEDTIDHLKWAIERRMYDFAFNLIDQYPKLALDTALWKLLIENFENLPCRSRLNMLQSTTYSATAPPLESLVHRRRHRFAIVPAIKHLGMLKIKHHEELERVRILCMKIRMSSESDSLPIIRTVFKSTVRNGMPSIIEGILRTFLDLQDYIDNIDTIERVFKYGTSDSSKKTLHALHKRIAWYESIRWSVDNNGNNFMHLVAKRARRNQPEDNSKNVLQLQQEFRWYKEMEKLLPADLQLRKNSDKQLPLEVFGQEHNNMLKSESDWVTSMATSCMVGGSLVAAVVFAAAITFPGGNNDEGIPNFSKKVAFKVFAFSDAFALVCSLTTVVTFLSIFTTRQSVKSFLYDVPNRLIIGLISMLLAVAFVMVAFSATIYLLFAEDYKWIIYPTVALSFIPVFFFAYLQLPSLISIIRSTYRCKIMEDNTMKSTNEGIFLYLPSKNRTRPEFVNIADIDASFDIVN